MQVVLLSRLALAFVIYCVRKGDVSRGHVQCSWCDFHIVTYLDNIKLTNL